jgi:hypothetical protein
VGTSSVAHAADAADVDVIPTAYIARSSWWRHLLARWWRPRLQRYCSECGFTIVVIDGDCAWCQDYAADAWFDRARAHAALIRGSAR